MLFIIGLVGTILMIYGASTFWGKSRKIVSAIVLVAGIVLTTIASPAWMAVVLFISAIIFLSLVVRTRNIKVLQKRKAELDIPLNAELFRYKGGHPKLPAGKVFGWVSPEGVGFAGMTLGTKVFVPKTSIKSVDLHSDIQTINKGGGRSVGGAVVGGAIAGPVGAIVGGQKKTKVETIDRSTVQMRIADENGIESAMIFDGGQPIYNRLTKLIGTEAAKQQSL